MGGAREREGPAAPGVGKRSQKPPTNLQNLPSMHHAPLSEKSKGPCLDPQSRGDWATWSNLREQKHRQILENWGKRCNSLSHSTTQSSKL